MKRLDLRRGIGFRARLAGDPGKHQRDLVGGDLIHVLGRVERPQIRRHLLFRVADRAATAAGSASG